MDRTRLLIKLKRYHYGKRNAVSSKELEAAFFVSGKKIRDAVNALRQDGEPILHKANRGWLYSSGYYYATDAHEINHSIHQLGSRIVNIAKAQRGLIKASAKFIDTGQLSFGGEVISD